MRRLAVLALLGTTACGSQRVLGFGGGEATLLVRHTESSSQEISVDDELLGLADPDTVTCFEGIPTGTIRLQSRSAESGVLTRASTVVLPPDRSVLWDIDHDEVLDARTYMSLCEGS